VSPLIPVETTAPAGQDVERLVLDGLDFNPDFGLYTLEAFNCPPPRKRYEWAQGADSDGSALVRDPLFENRELTAQIRMEGASMDASLAAIAAITDKLEEAERQPDGLELVWTPAGATQSFTFHVLSGEIEEMPITIESGWLAAWPLITLKLIAKPFGYGAWVVGPSVSSSAPMLTLTVPGVPGDVAAEGRLVVKDNASQARRYIEWGMEQRHYNPATSLLLDSASLLDSGYAGTQGTRSGAYIASGVITGSVVSVPQRLCGTGELTHVGTFRAGARVYCTSLEARIRLVWRLGGGAEIANLYTGPVVANAFSEIDLGLVSLPLSTLGDHRWSAEIEAYHAVDEAVVTPLTPGTPVQIDYLALMPVSEGYGRARAPYIPRPDSVTLYDDFQSAASGAALNGRTAPYGTGTWGTTGTGSPDFRASNQRGNRVFYRDLPDSTTAPRGRFAVLGPAVRYQRVGVLFFLAGTEQDNTNAALIARFVNSTNYLRLKFAITRGTPTSVLGQLVLEKVVAGTATTLQAKNLAGVGGLTTQRWYFLSVVVATDGRIEGTLATKENRTASLAQVYGLDTVFATSGTLASGKPGIWDLNAAVQEGSPRFYDDFQVSVATVVPPPVVISSGGSIEFRHDETLRLDASATTWSRPPSAIGDRFFLEPAGVQNRSARIAVRAHREDVEVNKSSSTGDALTATAHYRPRYLAVPR
jgi:hypothetical protein